MRVDLSTCRVSVLFNQLLKGRKVGGVLRADPVVEGESIVGELGVRIDVKVTFKVVEEAALDTEANRNDFARVVGRVA